MNQDAPRPLSHQDELDRGLSRILDGAAATDTIAPSSGFAARVMESVRESAVAPPPLPFPWKRALPAFGCALAILLYAGMQLIGELRRLPAPVPSATMLRLPSAILSIAAPLGWTAFALLVAVISVKLCLRLAAPRA